MPKISGTVPTSRHTTNPNRASLARFRRVIYIYRFDRSRPFVGQDWLNLASRIGGHNSAIIKAYSGITIRKSALRNRCVHLPKQISIALIVGPTSGRIWSNQSRHGHCEALQREGALTIRGVCVLLFGNLFVKTTAWLSLYKSLFPHLRLLSKGTPAANEQIGLYGFMRALNGLCDGGVLHSFTKVL